MFSQKALFSSQVVKLHNATSYACRNRYGGAYQPLSEHALANALDVSEFVLASGEHITVLDNWPKVVSTPPAPVPNPARETVEKASAFTTAKAKGASNRLSFRGTHADIFKARQGDMFISIRRS